MSFEREEIGPGFQAAHDIGLAVILGGNLFARIGMHPALREVSDPRERGKVVNSAWRRYGTINSLGLAALIAGWAGSRLEEARRSQSERERMLGVIRDAAVIAVAATGVVAGVQGIRFSRMEPEGAIPLEDGSEAEETASVPEARAKRSLNLLGGLHLASALALAGVNARLRQAAAVSRRRRGLRRSRCG